MRRRAKTTILPSQNCAFGFYGTVADHHDWVAAEREWQKMSRRCIKAGLSSEACRDFLDSRVGRALADQVLERDVSASELKKDYIDWWRSTK